MDNVGLRATTDLYGSTELDNVGSRAMTDLYGSFELDDVVVDVLVELVESGWWTLTLPDVLQRHNMSSSTIGGPIQFMRLKNIPRL